MAKNILEFPNAATLAENDFFHVIQNGIDKKATFNQLPVVTKYNNGLMNSEDYRYSSSLLNDKKLKSKEEHDLGSFFCKLFVVGYNDSGRCAVFYVDSYAGSILISASENGFFTSIITQPGIFLGRKDTNGNVFIINNLSKEISVSVR